MSLYILQAYNSKNMSNRSSSKQHCLVGKKFPKAKARKKRNKAKARARREARQAEMANS
jgi:hypothetical protein